MRFFVYFLICGTIYLHGPMEPSPSPVMSFAWFTWETHVSTLGRHKPISRTPARPTGVLVWHLPAATLGGKMFILHMFLKGFVVASGNHKTSRNPTFFTESVQVATPDQKRHCELLDMEAFFVSQRQSGNLLAVALGPQNM